MERRYEIGATSFVDRLRLIRYLLSHGADPNFQALGNTLYEGYGFVSPQHTSSFHALLKSTLSVLIHISHTSAIGNLSDTSLRAIRAEILKVLEGFDTHHLDFAVRTCVGVYVRANEPTIPMQVGWFWNELYGPEFIKSDAQYSLYDSSYIIVLETDLRQLRQWVLYEVDSSSQKAPEIRQAAMVIDIGKGGLHRKLTYYVLEATEDKERLAHVVQPLIHGKNRPSLSDEATRACRKTKEIIRRLPVTGPDETVPYFKRLGLLPSKQQLEESMAGPPSPLSGLRTFDNLFEDGQSEK